MSKSLEKKAAVKAAKEEEKKLQEASEGQDIPDTVEDNERGASDSEESAPAKKEATFKVKIYLEGHKQPYIKEFANQGELERAKAEFKKNKSIIRFE